MMTIGGSVRTSCHKRYRVIIDQEELDDIGRAMGCDLDKNLSWLGHQLSKEFS
jgi:hypothetical protein